MTTPISSAMISPEASVAEQSRREMQARLNGLSGSSKLSEEAKAKKLREACEGFESIFIQKMWQEMRNTIPKGGMMHSQQEKIWQDMYDQELSKSMTSAGGIGLADMMYEQLSRNLISASRSAAGLTQSAAFTPGAAPLFQETAQAAPQEAPKPATPASVYDGEAPQTGHVGDVEKVDASKVDASDVQKAGGVKPQVPAAEPQLAATAGPVQPVMAPRPAAEATKARVEPHERPHKKSSRHYPAGPDLAQIAKREAGDKLGARAVRPPLRPQREPHEEPVASQVEQPVATPPQPGSPEALRAAMDLAKSGTASQPAASTMQLNDIVARLQARNVANTAQAAAEQTSAAEVVASSEPAEPTRKVTRFTTNIPKKSRNVKNGKQASNAIRMLNVDNVGVNSKAGQGIAAYHAARDSAAAQVESLPGAHQLGNNVAAPAAPAAPVQPAAPQVQAAMAAAPAAASIPPLTARDSQKSDGMDTNFAIPPLTAANRGS